MKSYLVAAKKIKLVIFDVDGVFTDGYLYLGDDGQEIKAFHSQDGIGIRMLQRCGIMVAVITARCSKLVERRIQQDLGIEYLYQGVSDKFERYQCLKQHLQLQDQDIAMVGDDLPDLKIICHCGLGIAVANARPLVKKSAKYVTRCTGGHGAVREVCEMLMQAQNCLDSAQGYYL